MLELLTDHRLGGNPHYYLGEENDIFMEIADEVRKCVAFIAYRDAHGFRLSGTSFFVAIPFVEDLEGQHFVYLVTAKHLIEGIREKSIDQKVYVRLNFTNKPADLIGTSIEQWVYHPTDASVDVAILPWAPPDMIDYLSFPISMALTDERIKTYHIGPGSEVFVTGLFVKHSGDRNNLPIIRVGNIALMPEEPITTKVGLIDAYLIEARSIGGLSGSPVFIPLPEVVARDGKIKFLEPAGVIYWLGLIRGHWKLPISSADFILDDELNQEAINMGIAVVVPASKVSDVINQPREVKRRTEEEKQVREKGFADIRRH